jgi:hypothetical protein
MKNLFIPFLALLVFSCKDGDDAALFNNTNETVFDINIPMSYSFDRRTTPVVVAFYDNDEFKGKPVKSENLYMVEIDENDKEKVVEDYNTTHLNLLKEGNYFAYCFIDLNKNGRRENNEPIEYFTSREHPKKIRVLKESRRTISFDFDV